MWSENVMDRQADRRTILNSHAKNILHKDKSILHVMDTQTDVQTIWESHAENILHKDKIILQVYT
jgi:hypothetical protein